MLEVQSVEEFEDVISKGTVLVDFYADWCSPCKAQSPILEKLSEEYQNVTFVKVNIENLQDLARAHNIRSIPTLILFKDSKYLDTMIGLKTKIALEDFLNKNV
jgi:thioredoxin 1